MTKQLSQKKKILIYIYLLNETSNTSTLSGFARAGNALTYFHETLSTACTLINIGRNSPVITNLHTKMSVHDCLCNVNSVLLNFFP